MKITNAWGHEYDTEDIERHEKLQAAKTRKAESAFVNAQHVKGASGEHQKNRETCESFLKPQIG